MDYYQLENKITKLYEKEYDMRQIAYKLGLDVQVVSFFLHQSGVKIRKQSGRYKDIPIDEIKRLYIEENYSVLDLSVVYNVSGPTIINRLKKANVKLRWRKDNNKFNKDKLYKYYIVDNLTIVQLAELLNATPNAITYHLRKHRISKRGVY